MASENFKIDSNYKGVIGGVTDDLDLDILALRMNPTTKRLKVEATTTSSDVPTISNIYNVVMASGTTEYSQTLPADTKRLIVRLRSLNTTLKVCFTSGESGGTFFTVPYGATLDLENINISAGTVYFQSPTASQVCEIIAWT